MSPAGTGTSGGGAVGGGPVGGGAVGGGEGAVWRALVWAIDRLADATGPTAASDAPAPPDPPWALDASDDHERYRAWLASRPGPPVASMRGGGASFSIVVPVYRTDLWVLDRCVASVRAQTWPAWELCLCDDGSAQPELTSYLRRLARRDPSRIKVAALESNQGISAATNRALEMASGDFVALLDHDDELAPGALAWMAAALSANPEADVAYSDEDKLDPDGLAFGPRFKPDWSPDYLLMTPYVGHLFVIRRTLLESLDGMRPELDGSQDYDLMLRATEAARAVLHVPEVAYHWRVVPGSAAGDSTAKPWAYAASGRALTSALRRRGEDAQVEPGPMPGMWHVRRRLPPGTTVSALVTAATGAARQLRRCVDALTGGDGAEAEMLGAGTDGPFVVDVTVIGPSEVDLETRALLVHLADRPGVRVIHSSAGAGGERIRALNLAARSATGGLVLLLDCRVAPDTRNDWLAAMAEHALRPEIGPVGARLVTPAGRVHHVGLVLGLGGQPAGAVLEGLPASGYGYLEAARVTRNWSAVSGECLMIRTELLRRLDHLDPGMGRWADVDLCLRAAAMGGRCVVSVLAELEADVPPTGVGVGREAEGARLFMERWGDAVRAGDPYFSTHLSRLQP
ncbi:MAG: glycosyltransferase family 2 protein, partial [Acidimicrobiales bacterium]